MNLEHGEHTYRSLSSNLLCFSKLLIPKLLIRPKSKIQTIQSLKQLLLSISFEKFMVKGHCVNWTLQSIPNKWRIAYGIAHS